MPAMPGSARGLITWLAPLLLWQFVSVLLTATGFCSQRLAALGIDAPTAQSAANYVLLSLHWVPLAGGCRARAAPESSAHMRWWHWLLIAFADVEANYLLVKAYQFTDITSVCVLDAFTIPTVIVLSASCFGTSYSWRQLLAAALCLGGIVALFASDLLQNSAGGRFPHAWIGDLLVLSGAALYGVSNVAQEHLVRCVVEPVEYLAHLGLYGAVIALVQVALFERAALESAWTRASELGRSEMIELAALEVGFIGSLFGFYLFVAHLLARGSSATLMNLSLLTSDFWSVAVGVSLLDSNPGGVYAGAFSLVVAGLALYHCGGEEARERRDGIGHTPLTCPLVPSDQDEQQPYDSLHEAPVSNNGGAGRRDEHGHLQQGSAWGGAGGPHGRPP